MDNKLQAEAVLLAQDIIKNPQAVGTATAQSVKAGPSGSFTETITYTVTRGEMKKLPNGQDDITQLPNITFTVTNTVSPEGSAPTGSIRILMSYSGAIVGAFGILNVPDGDSQGVQSQLEPAEALTIAKEAVAAIKASNS
jgi:hypothetical protein